MDLLRKHWTPSDADDWTVHDLLASFFSMGSYILVGIGTIGALLLRVWGFIALTIGIICSILMYLVIDPKLRAMSEAFAKRQQKYLEYINKTTRWEE